MLEVRKASGLEDVKGGGSSSGISRYLGKGKLRKEETNSAKAVSKAASGELHKRQRSGRGESSTQFSLPKITFESPYKI